MDYNIFVNGRGFHSHGGFQDLTGFLRRAGIRVRYRERRDISVTWRARGISSRGASGRGAPQRETQNREGPRGALSAPSAPVSPAGLNMTQLRAVDYGLAQNVPIDEQNQLHWELMEVPNQEPLNQEQPDQEPPNQPPNQEPPNQDPPNEINQQPS